MKSLLFFVFIYLCIDHVIIKCEGRLGAVGVSDLMTHQVKDDVKKPAMKPVVVKKPAKKPVVVKKPAKKPVVMKKPAKKPVSAPISAPTVTRWIAGGYLYGARCTTSSQCITKKCVGGKCVY